MCRVVQVESYPAPGSLRNMQANRALDDLHRIASSRQCTGGTETAAELTGQAIGALALGYERGQSRLGQAFGDAAAAELGADALVGETAICKAAGALEGDPAVVEIAGLDGASERGGTRVPVEPGASEPLVELGRREVAAGQSLDDGNERVAGHAWAGAASSTSASSPFRAGPPFVAGGSAGSVDAESVATAEGSNRAETTCPSSA